MQEGLLPFIETVQSREPGVLMAMLGIYSIGLRDPKYGFTAELAGTRILPFCGPLLVNPGLNSKQLGSWLKFVRDAVAFIEKERIEKIKAIESLHAEAKTTTDLASGDADAGVFGRALTGMKSAVSSAADTVFDLAGATSAARRADEAAAAAQEEAAAKREQEAFPTPSGNPFAAVAEPAKAAASPLFAGVGATATATASGGTSSGIGSLAPMGGTGASGLGSLAPMGGTGTTGLGSLAPMSGGGTSGVGSLTPTSSSGLASLAPMSRSGSNGLASLAPMSSSGASGLGSLAPMSSSGGMGGLASLSAMGGAAPMNGGGLNSLTPMGGGAPMNGGGLNSLAPMGGTGVLAPMGGGASGPYGMQQQPMGGVMGPPQGGMSVMQPMAQMPGMGLGSAQQGLGLPPMAGASAKGRNGGLDSLI